MERSRGAQVFLKFCHFVAGPPRTQELRGCCDRGREDQRVLMASPPAWIQPARPIGHTQRVCFRGAKETWSSLCSGGCDHPALSLLSLYREEHCAVLSTWLHIRGFIRRPCDLCVIFVIFILTKFSPLSSSLIFNFQTFYCNI